ncbi:Phospholipase A1 member A [Blattella germanica]|nr:Phospholipase A1 member A [Blattella germanica]
MAFRKRGEVNVIALDWSGYSTKDYITALLNCVIQVARAADIIKKMVARGIPLENFHLVGFSLGAQCASSIGKRFKEQKLKIITGLDPAGPIAGYFYQTSLHKGDAEFVQIIHTDRGIYGTSRSCGDFDVFFNNDGYRIQPGCPFLV